MSIYFNAKCFLWLSVVDFWLYKRGEQGSGSLCKVENGNRARQETNRQNANFIFSSFWRHSSCQATHTHKQQQSNTLWFSLGSDHSFVCCCAWRLDIGLSKYLAKWKIPLRNIEEICVRADWKCLKCQAEQTWSDAFCLPPFMFHKLNL